MPQTDMQQKSSNLTQPIVLLVLLYYVILFAERAQSLIRVLAHGAFFATAFDGYVDTLTLLSLLATVALLATRNGDFWQALTKKGAPDYTRLSVTCGVLLLGGMVHTEYTVAPVQFVAYGMLIAAMVLRAVEVAPGKDRFRLWYSLVYLTVFSMAIPVMYRSFLPHSAMFHVIEAATAIVLVFLFTLLMRRVFLGSGEDLLYREPMAVAVVADTVILALRWQEKINTFVLIFAALTLVLFLLGKLLFRLRKAA